MMLRRCFIILGILQLFGRKDDQYSSSNTMRDRQLPVLPAAFCMSAPEQPFCFTMSSGANTFNKFIGTCIWQNTTKISVTHTCEDTDRGDSSSFGNFSCVQQGTQVQAESCTEHDGWQAFRVGPYFTVGNRAWTAMLSAVITDIDYVAPSIHAFSEFALGNMDDNLQLVPYPPIHQHHFHFFGSGNAFISDMNNHGDNQCVQEEGGTDCLVRSAPRNAAWIIRDPVGVSTQFNDVRHTTLHVLRTWALVAFVVTNITLVRTRQIIHTGIYFRPPSEWGHGNGNAGYVLRVVSETVGWSSRNFSYGGHDIVEAYMHTHADMLVDMWLLRGNTRMVFHQPEDVEASHEKLLSGEGVIEQLSHNIRKRQMDPHAASLACSYMSASRTEWLTGSLYYRRPRCRVGLDGHTQITLVLMHKMRNALFGDYYFVHSGVRIYVLGSEGIAMVQKVEEPVRTSWGFDYDQNTYAWKF